MAAPSLHQRQATLNLRAIGGAGLGPIDLDLPAGCHGCLLGPPGAGKTKLLRRVAGLSRGAGSVRVNGTPIDADKPGARGFAWLARGGAPPPLRTADACLGFARAPDAARAVLLEEWALDPAADPACLDSAARLRLRLAVALAGTPRLLLIDEPIDDADTQDRLRAAIARRGLTVLHATARRDEAFALAGRLFLIEHGRIIQHGTPSQLYEQPRSLEIACKTGPANVLPGTLLTIEDDTAVIRLDCGPVIHANPPDPDLADGAACLVLLRPERIAVSPLPTANLGEDAVAAILREVTHMGATIRLGLAIGTDTLVTVARPAALGDRGLIAGRTVSIAWQSHHALTFPA